jgi:branched-chain amino acid transport system ATP-binding protein
MDKWSGRITLGDKDIGGLAPHLITRAGLAYVPEYRGVFAGLTAIFVEHDMEIVFAIADWVTVMAEGAVLAEGTPEEIRRNPLVIQAYLGSDESLDEELVGAR